MSTEAFRKAVQGRVEDWRAAAHPLVPAFYENGPVADESAVGPIWIDCLIRWYGSKLVSVGERPAGRHSGTILTNVYFRGGEGTARPDQIIDELVELLRAKRVGGALLTMPQRTVPTDFFGWYKAGLLTPFTLDSA